MCTCRNSVIYRIQKIQDILALDLDDPDVRLRLMISFKILEMTSRIPHWETPHGENDAGNSGIVHQVTVSRPLSPETGESGRFRHFCTVSCAEAEKRRFE